MLYVKNVPTAERAIRIMMGLALLGGALVWLGPTTAGWVVGAMGMMASLSGLMGCVRCAPWRPGSSNPSIRVIRRSLLARSISVQQQRLILAAQSGDTAALNQLLSVCQTDARRYARRHCAASNVDDAVQEALLILSRKVKGLKAPAAFSGWLFTIVRRECQRLSRKMFGQDLSIEDLADEQLATRSDEALQLDLIRARDSLSAHYLEVVLLRDFAELTISEMAQKLALQVPGVKSRLHRARELVREYLVGPVSQPPRHD
jgi:RNA polymerase sigma factor (sigma-70 family)